MSIYTTSVHSEKTILKYNRFQFKWSKVGVSFFYPSANIMEKRKNTKKIRYKRYSFPNVQNRFSLEKTKYVLKMMSNRPSREDIWEILKTESLIDVSVSTSFVVSKLN